MLYTFGGVKSLSLVRLAEVIGHCLRATRFLKCDFVVEDYWFTWYVHFPRESSLLGFFFFLSFLIKW